MKKTFIFIPYAAVIVISLFSLFFMYRASSHDSLIMDEMAHIPAGYGYMHFLDYRLNPEHPPLVKAISALPLLFLNLNFPVSNDFWQKDVNGQWVGGAQFIFESGNDADKIIFWSRIGPMILTILLVLFIYFWAANLIGRWWGLAPAFMFAFSPTVLAHGHYVTTDVGAAFGIFAASYFFIKYLESPSRKNFWLAGVFLGIAELLKFSAVLLFPFFIFLTFLKAYKEAKSSETLIKNTYSFFIKFIKLISKLTIIVLIAFIVVYFFYFIFTFNYPVERQVSDTKFLLSSFAGGPTASGETCNLTRCFAEADIVMADNVFLRPISEYLLGVLMVMQRSSAGNSGYFMGEVSSSGWISYFPVTYIAKETLPTLILIITGLVLALARMARGVYNRERKRIRHYLQTNFAEFSMASFVVFYWIYSIKSPLNIGVRHILPTLPFIYILSISSIKKWAINKGSYGNSNFIKSFFSSTARNVFQAGKVFLIIAVLAWLFIETASASPYFLSYYNTLAGGTREGYKIATDSNYDWGQDLKRLEEFVEKNNIKKIAVDYFGGDSLTYRLGEKFAPWWSARNDPREEGIEWLAVSVNTLNQATAKPHQGFERKQEDEYLWLKSARSLPLLLSEPPKPDFIAGTSIFIYHLKKS